MAGFKRKRFSRGKRTFKRRRFRRPRSTFGLAKRAYRGVKRLQAGIETKQGVTVLGFTSINTGATQPRFLTMCPQIIIQGTANAQRIGEMVQCMSSEIQFTVQQNGAFVEPQCHVHFVLFLIRNWNQRDFSTFDPISATGMYQDNSTAATGYYSNMTRRWKTRKDFRVIKHWSRILSNGSSPGYTIYPSIWKFHKHINHRRLKTIYAANGGVTTDIQHNILMGMWWWAGVTDTTTGPPSVACTWRLKFQDA